MPSRRLVEERMRETTCADCKRLIANEMGSQSPSVTEQILASVTRPTLTVGGPVTTAAILSSNASASIRSCGCQQAGVIASESRDYCNKHACTCRCHPENR